ncbi:MAG: gliding motility-associated C-terminal domain-containing protein [Prolixibacteraceae bacterium]|nr:gliding motility-associated C-terminal domain-containing protein [Prolixibacteraceae bacterium]
MAFWKFSLFITAFLLGMLFHLNGRGQAIDAPNADYSKATNYFSTIDNDSVYVFCIYPDDDPNGSLRALSVSGYNSTFTWEVYDTLSAGFVPYTGSLSEDTLKSSISRLSDGLYRVTIDDGNTVFEEQAWVINSWVRITKTEIPDTLSTCEGFQIYADYEMKDLNYYDPNTNERITLRNPEKKDYVSIRWYQENNWVYSQLNPYVTPAIPSDNLIDFRLEITDEFGCMAEQTVQYDSKVTDAVFEDPDPMEGEAVLEVTFTNSSINWDSTIWFFYKDDNIIKKEIEEKAEKGDDEPVDSIDFILYDESPVYEYERTGDYRIKLVTVKVNPTTGNCYDTMYMAAGEFIKVDTSLVQAPNFFTPNGDGVNDVFVVKSQSLKSMTIKIYNRWGGLVHSWKYDNIRSKDYTYEHSVWDGRINGGGMATPGVYFYIVNAVGRDDKRRNQKGFIHLFRNK